MTENQTSSQSVVSPPTSTLQQLKEIAGLFETGSNTKKIRRVALALRLTVGLRRKLTGYVISAFLDFALVPGSEAHTRLINFVKVEHKKISKICDINTDSSRLLGNGSVASSSNSNGTHACVGHGGLPDKNISKLLTDEYDKEVDTTSSTSQAPPKHLHVEVEIYCFFMVLLFLIDEKNYNEAKHCSVATIGRLKSENRRIVGAIAQHFYIYYYLRYEHTDELAEIHSTLLPLHELATLQTEELAKVMDPNDPFFHQNFQPNFMDTHTSFSPSIQINSSQFPESSTQFSDTQNQPAKSREIRTRWTSTEDMVLISAWLNTSKDPVVGNEQRACAFWKRVVSYYAASEDVAGFSPRGSTQCSQRWKKISSECNKFVGCYSQASAMRGSGQSEDDVFQLAIQFYFSDKKKPFLLEHAWRALRHEQKWLCSFGNETSKRTKNSASGAYTSSSNTDSRVEEEACARPAGVKAAKRKGKRTVPSSDSEATPLLQLEKMWGIKEKDIASRDMAADKRVLANLIAKKDLDDDELDVKKMLMSKLFKN